MSGHLSQRHNIEATFHDRNEQRRGATFAYKLGILEPVDLYAYKLLGEITDKTVVDFGCGTGWNAVRLAQQGARVWTFDLSEGMLEAAKKLAKENRVQDSIRFEQMLAEDLRYSDSSVDAIFGQGILHHLDLQLASKQIHRVLKRGGKAVFVEPLAYNIFLNFFRGSLPIDERRPRGLCELRI